MKQYLRLLLACALCLPAFSVEPKKRQLINQLTEVMHLKESLEQVRLQVIEMVRKSLEQEAGDKAHQIYFVRVRNRMMEKYTVYLDEVFGWDKVRERYVEFYDSTYTEPQLKELIAFLQTSTGQAMLRSQGALGQLQQSLLQAAGDPRKQGELMYCDAAKEVETEMRASSRDLRKASIEELRKIAENGDVEAQSLLAAAYAEGKGVDKNIPEAISWLEKAAENGNLRAHVMVGALYYDGKEVPKDFDRARIHFQKAAAGGDVWGSSSLAYMYRSGDGVTKDYKEAFRLFLLAAQAGHGPAQEEVAWMYWNGDGIEKNPSEAYAWIRVAEQSNVPTAFKTRDFMTERLSAGDLVAGMKRADELRQAFSGKPQPK